jgi:hypothetical protein
VSEEKRFEKSSICFASPLRYSAYLCVKDASLDAEIAEVRRVTQR